MASYRRLFALVLIACFIAGCAGVGLSPSPGDDDGIGGTGVVASTDGIGGTGRREDPDTDGLGGTGLWASAVGSGDVALYGLVTSLETLVVNGHGMFYSEQSEFLLNGQPADIAALKVGQLVAVRAGLVNGIITAKAIHADDAVIGPIDSIGANGAWLEVLGQRVVLGDYTRILVERGQDKSSQLRRGDVVRISGLRRLDDSIDASLVQLAEPDASYSVAGWAIQTEDNHYQIGALLFAGVELAPVPDRGQRLFVTGDIRGGDFEVQQISTRPALPFAGDVNYWSVQGYATKDPGVEQVRFASYRGPLGGGGDSALGLGTEQRVIMDIRTGGARVPEIRRVAPSPPQRPESSLYIPRYAPNIMRPNVEFAPSVRLPEPNTDPIISAPRRPPVVDRQTIGVPVVPRTPTARPAIPKPLPPRVDIGPKPRPLPPITDTRPSSVVRPGP